MDYQTRHRLDDIKYRAIKQHVRDQVDKEIRFSLQQAKVPTKTRMAEFINPAVRNLGMLGGGLGAVKGALEPAYDDTGMPVSLNQRLGNVALNALGGGVAGAGAGVGYRSLKPGLSQATKTAANSIESIPELIQPSRNTPLLKRIQNVANSDTRPLDSTPARDTFKAVKERAIRDSNKTRRFFTGKGAGYDMVETPVGVTKTIYDPASGTNTRMFIPKVDSSGKDVMQTAEVFNPNAVLDEIPTASRIAGSALGGTTGAAIGLAGSGIGAGIGAGLGGAVGMLGMNPATVAGGAAIGAKLGAVAGAAVPTIVGGTQGARLGVGKGAQWVKNRAVNDIERAKELGQRVAGTEPIKRARDWLGFEYSNTTVNFGNSAPANYYKTGALVGTGLGAGVGALGSMSDTLRRQQDREEMELQNITDIDDPYMRVGAYREYTSKEQSDLRKLRDVGDLAARGALGLGMGAGVGLGLGGGMGQILSPTQRKRSLLGLRKG